MHIVELEIENLRTISSACLRLNHGGISSELELPNVNLILGNNGMGKSTILRAMALGMLSPVIESTGYVPYSLVRREGDVFHDFASIRTKFLLHKQDSASGSSNDPYVELTTRVTRRRTTEFVEPLSEINRAFWDSMYDDKSPAFLFLGYGATRRVESSSSIDESSRKKSRHLRYQRVASLFEDHVSLIPLSSWLPKLKRSNPGRYTQVVHLIDRLLPQPFSFDGSVENGEVMFHQGDQPVPFPALSDGYKAYIGWVSDLLYHVCMGCPKGKKLVDNYGIVMIDEVDLHLHPAWQRTVVPMVSRALPNIQFILTTHSPIVTGTLQSGNIFVVQENSTGACGVIQLDEGVHGLTSEQVLLSSYFGLDSTRAPSVTEKLMSFSMDPDSGDTESAIKALKVLTRPQEALPAGDIRKAVRRVAKKAARPRIPVPLAKAAKKSTAKKVAKRARRKK